MAISNTETFCGAKLNTLSTGTSSGRITCEYPFKESVGSLHVLRLEEYFHQKNGGFIDSKHCYFRQKKLIVPRTDVTVSFHFFRKKAIRFFRFVTPVTHENREFFAKNYNL
jgi:hypothetical protein